MTQRRGVNDGTLGRLRKAVLGRMISDSQVLMFVSWTFAWTAPGPHRSIYRFPCSRHGGDASRIVVGISRVRVDALENSRLSLQFEPTRHERSRDLPIRPANSSARPTPTIRNISSNIVAALPPKPFHLPISSRRAAFTTSRRVTKPPRDAHTRPSAPSGSRRRTRPGYPPGARSRTGGI